MCWVLTRFMFPSDQLQRFLFHFLWWSLMLSFTKIFIFALPWLRLKNMVMRLWHSELTMAIVWDWLLQLHLIRWYHTSSEPGEMIFLISPLSLACCSANWWRNTNIFGILRCDQDFSQLKPKYFVVSSDCLWWHLSEVLVAGRYFEGWTVWCKFHFSQATQIILILSSHSPGETVSRPPLTLQTNARH